MVLLRLFKLYQGFAIAVLPGCPWHQTFSPGRLEYLSFNIATLHWAPWRTTVYELAPFNFLRAEPWQKIPKKKKFKPQKIDHNVPGPPHQILHYLWITK